jgi:hypothetical protein
VLLASIQYRYRNTESPLRVRQAALGRLRRNSFVCLFKAGTDATRWKATGRQCQQLASPYASSRHIGPPATEKRERAQWDDVSHMAATARARGWAQPRNSGGESQIQCHSCRPTDPRYLPWRGRWTERTPAFKHGVWLWLWLLTSVTRIRIREARRCVWGTLKYCTQSAHRRMLRIVKIRGGTSQLAAPPMADLSFLWSQSAMI